MVVSSTASSSYLFIDCGCTTHISGCRSTLITYTEQPPSTNEVQWYNGVTWFASGNGSVRLLCQLPDGRTETIILQEVVHLPGLFKFISHSGVMDKDVKVEQVNHSSLSLYNRHSVLIATAPHGNGRFVLDLVLDGALESTEYTDIGNHICRLPLKMTAHASRQDAEKRMLWYRRLAQIGLKALEILPKVVANPLKMTGQCNCESCIKSPSARKPFTPNTTSCATEPSHLKPSDRWRPLATAIGRGRYMLLFIDDTTSHTDEYILNYEYEALEKFRECKVLTVKELGKQVRRFCTDGGGEYTSKNLQIT